MPQLLAVTQKVALNVEFEGALVIGRHIANSLPLPDTEISRRHAQIFPRGGEYFLTDLGSRNGAYINGEKVKEQALKPGDEIAIGMSILFFNPPKKANPASLLSPRGEVLYEKIEPKPEFQPFKVTTFSRGELDETIGDWVSHPGSQPLLSLPMAAKLLDYLMHTSEWTTRKELCQGTLRFLQERIGGERLILMATDAKKRNLQAQGVVHPEGELGFQLAKDVLRVVMDGEMASYCSDCSADYRFSRMIKHGDQPVGSFLAVPIFIKTQYYGFIYADYGPGAAFFDERSLLQAHIIASLLAQCIHWLNVGRSKRGEA